MLLDLHSHLLCFTCIFCKQKFVFFLARLASLSRRGGQWWGAYAGLPQLWRKTELGAHGRRPAPPRPYQNVRLRERGTSGRWRRTQRQSAFYFLLERNFGLTDFFVGAGKKAGWPVWVHPHQDQMPPAAGGWLQVLPRNGRLQHQKHH